MEAVAGFCVCVQEEVAPSAELVEEFLVRAAERDLCPLAISVGLSRAAERAGRGRQVLPALHPAALGRNTGLDVDPVGVALGRSLREDERGDHGVLFALSAFHAVAACDLLCVCLLRESPCSSRACLGLPEEDLAAVVVILHGDHYLARPRAARCRGDLGYCLMTGSSVAVGGADICRGVGPAGVGTSASRPSSAPSAALPSSTAAFSSSVSGMAASMRCRLSLASSS